MIVIPDFIAYPLITWLVATFWFKRHELFGVDEEDFQHDK